MDSAEFGTTVEFGLGALDSFAARAVD